MASIWRRVWQVSCRRRIERGWSRLPPRAPPTVRCWLRRNEFAYANCLTRIAPCPGVRLRGRGRVARAALRDRTPALGDRGSAASSSAAGVPTLCVLERANAPGALDRSRSSERCSTLPCASSPALRTPGEHKCAARCAGSLAEQCNDPATRVVNHFICGDDVRVHSVDKWSRQACAVWFSLCTIGA